MKSALLVSGFEESVIIDGQNVEFFYSSKVTRSGALLDESKILLRCWEFSLSLEENFERFKNQNFLAKGSRQRVGHILMPFKQRFAHSEDQVRALSVLAQSHLTAAALDAILFFYTLRADLLLRDLAVDVLPQVRAAGKATIVAADLEPFIEAWVEDGKTLGRWSASTIRAIAVAALTALRNFRVLQGLRQKTWARRELPLHAFAFIACQLHTEIPAGEKLLAHPAWRVWELSPIAVEALFVEAHVHKLLEFHAAGSVMRLEFPSFISSVSQRPTLEEYARVIASRSL